MSVNADASAPWVSTYPTASEVLGYEISLGERAKLWAGVPLDQALVLIANMLKDHDLGLTNSRAVDAGWVREVQDDGLKASLTKAVASGQHLIAPQLLLLAATEALEFCSPGPASNTLEGLDEVLMAVLGIGDEAGSPEPVGESWATLDLGLASELIANGHFNQTADPIHLMAWTNENWRSAWPAGVPNSAVKKAGGQPGELFREATGIEIDEFISVAVHLWAQAGQRGTLRFPSEFFDQLGVDRPAVELFLAATSGSVDELRTTAKVERDDSNGSQWAFHAMRRHPLVCLDDGSWLVLRLGFLIERTLSDTTFWDVRNYLKSQDEARGTNRFDRFDAFMNCIEAAFESQVAESLKRMFPALAGHSRVFTERDMQHAWKKKGGLPSVCDFAVDCGPIWLLFDATNRRITESTINATADGAHLDVELNRTLTDKKARQFAATARLLRNERRKLTDRDALDETWYVPIVVTPAGGLGWSPPVSIRSDEILAEAGVLQGARMHRLAIMTIRDLRALESAMEQGQAADKLLVEWRTGSHGLAFDQFIGQKPGVILSRPRWEGKVASSVMDMIIARSKMVEKIDAGT